jgi:hypothetical protein
LSSEASSSSEQSFEFTLFPKFPIELRLKVWKQALPGPRIIGIHVAGGYNLDHDREGMPEWQVRSPKLAPSIFFVCKESREVVSKTYKSLKGTKSPSTGVFCDLDRDYLALYDFHHYFQWYSFLQYALPEDFRKTVRRIIIHFRDLDDFGMIEGSPGAYRPGFLEGLEHVSMDIKGHYGLPMTGLTGNESEKELSAKWTHPTLGLMFEECKATLQAIMLTSNPDDQLPLLTLGTYTTLKLDIPYVGIKEVDPESFPSHVTTTPRFVIFPEVSQEVVSSAPAS